MWNVMCLFQDVGGLVDYHPHARDYGSHLPHGSLTQPHRRRPSLLSEFQPGSERYKTCTWTDNILWLPELPCTEILSIQSCPFMSFRLVAHFAHNLLLSLSKLWQKAVTAMANTEENYHSHSKCCFREAFIRPGHKVLFCHSPCQFYSAYLALGGDWSRLLLLCNAYAMML